MCGDAGRREGGHLQCGLFRSGFGGTRLRGFQSANRVDEGGFARAGEAGHPEVVVVDAVDAQLPARGLTDLFGRPARNVGQIQGFGGRGFAHLVKDLDDNID